MRYSAKNHCNQLVQEMIHQRLMTEVFRTSARQPTAFSKLLS
jgi:hypothetical protein